MTETFDDWVDRARETDLLSLAIQLGATVKRAGREYVGGCPVCGDDGKRDADRFSVNPAKRIFRCRKCNVRGDVIGLMMFCESCDFMLACEKINGCPPPRMQSLETEADRAARIAAIEKRAAENARKASERVKEADFYRNREFDKAWEIWSESGPIEGTVVEAYLRARGIRHLDGLRLRCHAGLGYWIAEGHAFKRIATLPAMVAAMCLPSGEFRGVHLTYLDAVEPQKARLVHPETGESLKAKKMRGSLDGAVIRIAGRANDPARLIMGEGIETTLSRRERMILRGIDVSGIAFWSGLSLGNIGGRAAETVPRIDGKKAIDKAGRARTLKIGAPVPAPESGGIDLPDSVTDALILMDGDSDPLSTEYDTRRAAARWVRSGRVIRRDQAPAGLDENDVLLRELGMWVA